MNALIDRGETVTTPLREIDLPQWIRIIDDSPVEKNVKPPERLPEPAEVPEQLPPIESSSDTTPVGVTGAPATPTTPVLTSGTLGNVDSGLINIINAQPDYPIAASQKGLEGYVIVSFDVTELGTVDNVEILETSSSVFNRAAIKAAYRSRYKPKTVDGTSQRTQGLRKMFRFEMEN